MSTFESRRFYRSIAVGIVLTLLACLADQLGLLQTLDDWFYDERARRCQVFSSRPDNRIVHINIDDASLDPSAVGRWPWPRATLARIITEIGRAKPAAVALDLQLTEPETAAADEASDTKSITAAPPVDDDALLTESLTTQKTAILATLFHLLDAESELPAQTAARKAMEANLELTPTELLEKLRRGGGDFAGLYDVQDLFAHARAEAMRQCVSRELALSPLTDEQLISRLLPHTEPTVKSPLLRVLKEAAAAFRARKDFRRFGLDVPALAVPVVFGEFDRMPVATLSQSATYCGFVNFDIFPGATVRQIPLMVESEGRLYPQLGLVLGCAVMGADVRKARVQANQIIISKPGAGELHIPTHSFYSKSQKRSFSAIYDIPYFGGSRWDTMFDWPNNSQKINHLSVNIVWDICSTIDKIRVNNRSYDKAIHELFSNEGAFKWDNDFAQVYAANLPGIDDTAARQKHAVDALAKLKDSHLLEDFAAIPASTRTLEEREQLEQLLGAKKALEIENNNHGFYQQLAELRSNLAARLSGKGVLIGFTAGGTFDVINTSLVARCPGVVVHGVIAESILSGRWWRRAANWVGIALLLLMGFSATLFVSRLPPVRAVLAALLLIGLYLLFNGFIFFDYNGWIVPVAGPVVAISMVWSGCTLQRVIYEGFERNRVATEVAIINREMDLAHQVQAALIPKKPPAIPGLEAEGWTLPASTTGGDCYDLWALGDGRLAVLVADASGHGLAPAMIVSQVRTLVRAMSELNLHPHELLRRINTRVAEDLEAGRFITVFLGFFSATGLLEYASAGHGPQFWYACDGCELQLLESTGAPLGCDTEWYCDPPLPPIQVDAGGTLAVFSDGIFEAMSPSGELFGIDRLKEILHTLRGQPGKTIIDNVIDAMLKWQKSPQPADDQTVVIARLT